MTGDTELDVTVRQVHVRDRETGDETTAWNVESEQMPRPCRGETPADALRILADSLDADPDERVSVSVEDLAGDEVEVA